MNNVFTNPNFHIQGHSHTVRHPSCEFVTP